MAGVRTLPLICGRGKLKVLEGPDGLDVIRHVLQEGYSGSVLKIRGGCILEVYDKVIMHRV